LRDASYAEGGTGKMVRPQSAEQAKSGRTGKVQSPAPGKRAAAGGPKTSRDVSLVQPAKPGRTGAVKGR
jgi:hypothetical protein